jgi:hypothetical protein
METRAFSLDERRPVWVALSDLYLDTDVSDEVDRIARRLAASPYSIDELEEILRTEVSPVCRVNLASFAGEWAGFDGAWLEERIVARRNSRLSPIRNWFSNIDVHIGKHWRSIRSTIHELRTAGVDRAHPNPALNTDAERPQRAG